MTIRTTIEIEAGSVIEKINIKEKEIDYGRLSPLKLKKY
jgi:hypothetical protein